MRHLSRQGVRTYTGRPMRPGTARRETAGRGTSGVGGYAHAACGISPGIQGAKPTPLGPVSVPIQVYPSGPSRRARAATTLVHAGLTPPTRPNWIGARAHRRALPGIPGHAGRGVQGVWSHARGRVAALRLGPPGRPTPNLCQLAQVLLSPSVQPIRRTGQWPGGPHAALSGQSRAGAWCAPQGAVAHVPV
jgi:hypothetical protein